MKKVAVLLSLPFFLMGCEKMELEEKLSDSELLELAYDSNFFYPDDFYKDPASPEKSIYYVNTVSISPINQRDSRWIELSTNDKNEALKWLNLTIINSSDRVNHLLIEENETEKYFQFKYKQINENHNEYPIHFRVHKTNYYHSIFNGLAPWNHANETKYGHYNAEIEKSKIKECIEYLWVIHTFANYGQKVLNSEIKESEGYFEVHISSLSVTYGDWGLHDVVSVYDNYIRFNKSSKLITFKKTLRKEILGTYRP